MNLRRNLETLILIFLVLMPSFICLEALAGDAEVGRNRNLQHPQMESGDADVTRFRNLQAPDSAPNNADVIRCRNLQGLLSESNNADVVRKGNLQALELTDLLAWGDDDTDGIPNYLEDFNISASAPISVGYRVFDGLLGFAGHVYATQFETGSAKSDLAVHLLLHGATARGNLADYDLVALQVIDLDVHPFDSDCNSGLMRVLNLGGLMVAGAGPLLISWFEYLKSNDGNLRLAVVAYSKGSGEQATEDIDLYAVKENPSMPRHFGFVFTQVTQTRLRHLQKALIGILITLVVGLTGGVPAATVGTMIAGAVAISVADFVTNAIFDYVEGQRPDLESLLAKLKAVKLVVGSIPTIFSPSSNFMKLIGTGYRFLSYWADPNLQLVDQYGQVVLGVDYGSGTVINSSAQGIYFGSLNGTSCLMLLSKDFGPYNLTIVSPTAERTYYSMQVDDLSANSSFLMGGYVTNTSLPFGQVAINGNMTTATQLRLMPNFSSYRVNPISPFQVNVTITDQDGNLVSDAHVLIEIANTTYLEIWEATNLGSGKYGIAIERSPIYGECFLRVIASKAGYFQNFEVYEKEMVIPGDINGDRKVDLKDVFAVGKAYGSVVGDPRYSPNLDINDDGKIDLKDYYTTCKNYGKSW